MKTIDKVIEILKDEDKLRKCLIEYMCPKNFKADRTIIECPNCADDICYNCWNREYKESEE